MRLFQMSSPGLSHNRRAFLTGALLLSGTGVFCRVLGFFYRIFLSRTIGAQGLGLYGMVHPVFGICFSLCAASFQTALSQYAAANRNRGREAFSCCLILSFGISLILAALLCLFAPQIAEHFLLAPQCAPFLPFLALSLPFSAIHASVSGYYYGMQHAKVPAFSQAVEQIIRMSFVFALAALWQSQGRELTVTLALCGHLIGEVASAAFTALALFLVPPKSQSEPTSPIRSHFRPLLSLAAPLMASRLILNLLGSLESVCIPNRLILFGFTNEEAFSLYGVLTGMSLPFILFPSAFTNSVAVLLLPAVAKAQAERNDAQISRVITNCLRCSTYMGALCIGVFAIFGKDLGNVIFRNADSGIFIEILAWLCPFLYLATMLTSVLNGLGKTSATFLQNTLAMVLRLVFVLVAIPRFGILGYLWGMLASELFLAAMSLFTLRRLVSFCWDAKRVLLRPALALLLSWGVWYFFAPTFSLLPIPAFFQLFAEILFFTICYCGGLLLC